MIQTRFKYAALAAVAASLAVPAAAGAQAPPPPTAANGATVHTLAQGLPTPTQFAFYKRAVFVSAYGDPENATVKGGVFRIRKGKARRLRNAPRTVAGIAWRKGTRKLYVSAKRRIVVMSRWNVHRFLRSRTIYRGPQG